MLVVVTEILVTAHRLRPKGHVSEAGVSSPSGGMPKGGNILWLVR